MQIEVAIDKASVRLAVGCADLSTKEPAGVVFCVDERG